jgi:hypothetical protein
MNNHVPSTRLRSAKAGLRRQANNQITNTQTWFLESSLIIFFGYCDMVIGDYLELGIWILEFNLLRYGLR